MNDQIVHVLVCTFQGEKFIAKQLDSILNQTYSFIEIHVFDDCSSDTTVDIVKKYCVENGNIFIYQNKTNLGFLKNFEKAITNIDGNYIALCDQDDIWGSRKIELSIKEMKLLERQFPNTPALVHTDLTLIDEYGNLLASSFFEKKGISFDSNKSLNQLLGHSGVMGNTIFMNRLLVEKVIPFPPGLKYHDYWIALVNELYGVRKTINKITVNYRLHEKNVSNNNVVFQSVRGSGFFNRNYQLPFMEDKRELVMRHLLENHSLNLEDRALIEKFEEYLMLNGTRFSHFSFLISNGFLKKSLMYRINVFFRIFFTKRYSRISKYE